MRKDLPIGFPLDQVEPVSYSASWISALKVILMAILSLATPVALNRS